MNTIDANQTPEQNIRAMIADQLSEYHQHRANASALLRSADDPACDCGPDDECECETPWERGEYIAAARVEATLAQAAATTMSALTAFVSKA